MIYLQYLWCVQFIKEKNKVLEEGVKKQIRLNKVVKITGHVFNRELIILEILFPESKGILHNVTYSIYVKVHLCATVVAQSIVSEETAFPPTFVTLSSHLEGATAWTTPRKSTLLWKIRSLK